MNKKHIVVSGCSFTISDGVNIGTNNRSWAYGLIDYLQDENIEFHNVGISGGGNYAIAMSCINCVDNLLKQGIKKEDICVFVQWSGLFRPTIYVENGGARVLDFKEANTPYFSLKNISQDNGYFIDTAGQFRTDNPLWKNYFENFFSLPAAFIETLNNILKTQWFLESKDIKYKMFTAWDIFTTYDESIKRFGSDKVLNTNQFGDGIYENYKNPLLKALYPYSKHLWDMINWLNFWTFENKKVQFGGIVQWVQHNKEFKDWYVDYGTDFHIPNHTSMDFSKEIIVPLYNEMLGEKNEESV